MENIKAERVTVFMLLFVGICFILTGVLKGWEFWLPLVVGPVGIGLVVMHLLQALNERARWVCYFLYAAFVVLVYCVHDASQTHIALVFIVFLLIFSLAERLLFFNLILVELVLVSVIHVVQEIRRNFEAVDLTFFLSLIINTVLVLLVYFFCRSIVKNRLELKAELKKKDELQIDNDNDIEDFLSNISHELRTPINVISGMTTILMKDYDRDELDSIRQAGIRLTHQVEDIQDYTEIKQGTLALAEDTFMVVSLVNDMLAEYRMSDQNEDLELVVDLDPKVPASMKGDVRKIQKMLRHLLDNALKFTMTGGVYVHVSASPREYGINLIIEVTDTGCGIARKEMSRLSMGMYQANKKRNRSSGGIGLGLPVVYGFAHKMGGFVTIDSEGRGTTVRFSVPQKVVDSSPCLSVNQDFDGCLVFFNKPDKYSVPEVREFYQKMATGLAVSLGVRLYSAIEKEELIRLTEELSVTHVFMGQEEYEEEKAFFDKLGEQGYMVVVYSSERQNTARVGSVTMTSKPLYGFPIVRILNGDLEGDGGAGEGTGESEILLPGVRALIVDDEPMNLVVATGLFREYQMITDTAESGQEALDKYAESDYDIIFMDHMMPVMDGEEAMNRLRELGAKSGRNPVIVALTANALSSVREHLLEAGFNGFIAKPIDVHEFERVMKNVLPEGKIQFEGRAEA